MAQTRILQRGTVTEQLKGHFYRVSLEDHPEHLVLAKLCGTMRIQKIVVLMGDEVEVELSPYDLHRGRIIWRHT